MILVLKNNVTRVNLVLNGKSSNSVTIGGSVSRYVLTLRVGKEGPKGDKGDTGQGVPAGGSAGQVLAKNSTADYDTAWINQGAGVNGGVSVAGSSMSLGTVNFGNSNGISFGLNGSTLTASYNSNLYRQTSQDSQLQFTSNNSNFLGTAATASFLGTAATQSFRHTSADSQLQFTSQMSNYALTNHTHSQYINTSVSSNFLTSQSNQNISLYALGNTIQNSSTVINASALSFNGLGNITVGFSNGSVNISQTGAGGGAGDGYNIIAAGSQTANTSGTVLFQNSNGITFGMSNNSVITASHNGVTSQSNQAFSGSNASSTFQTISFGSSNGMHFYLTNGSLVGSYTVPSQTVQPVAASGSNGSFNFSTLSLGSSNGMHFYTTNGSIVGSYTVPTQSTQPVAASGSNGSFVFSTLSFGGSNGLTFYTTNGSIVGSYTVPTQSVQTQNMVSVLGSTGNISFANGNGVTFGGNASTITASHNGITSQSNQNLSLFGLGNTTQNSSTVLGAAALSFNAIGSLTVGYSNGSIQLSAPNAITSQSNQAFSGSNASSTFQTISFGSSNGMHFYLTNGSLVGSYTVPAQTVQPVAVSGSNGSFAFSTITLGSSNGMHFYTTNGSIVGSYTVPSQSVQTQNMVSIQGSTGNITFGNANGITFGFNASTVTASHNGITSQSNQNISLFALGNTTQNSSTVLNASQLSFNGLGNASVGFSNGSIHISVTGGGGGVTPVASASNGSFSFTTLAFSNANNVTFGTSAGGLITASVAAPGAAAENNWVNLLGANTSGNTTASGSTIGYSGINLTLSGTNGSVVNISAPATSSISATGQVSISVNGSTISIGVPDRVTNPAWEPYELGNNTAFSAPGQNSVYVQRLWPNANYSLINVEKLASLSFVSSTNSQQVAYTMSYGLYSRGTGASSTIMSRVATSSISYQASYNSNTAAGWTAGNANTSFTQSSAGTALFTNITAGRFLYLPFSGTLSEGVEYAFAYIMSSASTVGTSPLRMSLLVKTNINNLTWGRILNSTLVATNASNYEEFDQVVLSATSGALMATYADSQMTAAVSRARQYLLFE